MRILQHSKQVDITNFLDVSTQRTELFALINQTHPNIESTYEKRLQAEKLVLTAPSDLPIENRQILLAEPFIAINPQVHQRFSQTHLDKESGLCAIGYFLIAMFVIPFVFVEPELKVSVEVGFRVVSLCILMYVAFGCNARFLDRKIYPKLAAALRPMSPTPDEVQDLLKQLRKHEFKIASAIKIPVLFSHLETPFTKAG